MRADKFGSPILSTYAAGEPARQRRGGSDKPLGGSLAIPAIAILGTVSVAAIVSVSFEGETASVAGPHAGAGVSSPRAHPAGLAADGPAPSIDLADPELAARPPGIAPAAQPGASSGGSTARDLPFLGALRSGVDEQPARPVLRPMHAEQPARLALHPVAVPGRPAAAPVTGCAAECPADEAPEAAGLASAAPPSLELAAATTEPVDRPAEAPLAAPTEIVAEQAGDAPAAVGLAEPAVPLAADAAAEAGLVADANPPVVAELAGELVPAAASPVVVETPMTEAAVPEASAPALAPSEPVGEVALDPQQPDTPALAPDATVRSPSAGTIPQHLARIGERYSATSAEPAEPSPDEAAVAPAGAVAPQVLPGAAAPNGVVDATGAAMIVEENQLVAIRLGDLVKLFEDRLDHPLYVWMKSSAAASKFVTAESLAAAGIEAHVDPQTGQLVFSAGDE